MKKLFFLLFILSISILSGCTSSQEAVKEIESDPEMDAFAQCIKDSNLKMYGSFRCSYCQKQRMLFGPSFEIIGEIECHPHGENPQTELCLQMDVAKTPTWILEDGSEEPRRFEGYSGECPPEPCD